MSVLNIGNRLVGNNYPCFIIAEIGQNHQGDIELAKKLISDAKRIGVDCVKFQKSCLNEKFTKSALERSYISENAWGSTYGKHKEFLEFSIEQYKELQEFSNSIGILFSASAMDKVSLEQLINLNLPCIKIGSGDANNFPLLLHANTSTEIPLIISTGMQKLSTVHRIVNIMGDKKFGLLHCVSAYPTDPIDTNLRMIEEYRNLFPEKIIGYSGHERGIILSQIAVILGAKVIERHFTFDNKAKGTDHALSLVPDEFEQLIINIRKIEQEEKSNHFNIQSATNENVIDLLRKFNNLSCADENEIKLSLKFGIPKDIQKCEIACHKKLGKSLVFKRDLNLGHSLCMDDVSVKVSEPKGLPAELIDELVGQFLTENVFADSPILKKNLSL